MPPVYRACPVIVEVLIKKKENGGPSVVIYNKDVAYLMLPTDRPWNRAPIPHDIILQSLKVLRSAEKFPPVGYKAEEIPCHRGMAVSFTKLEGALVSG